MTEILTRPVTGWNIHSIGETLVLLDLQTVGSQPELMNVMSGQTKPASLPAIMTPAQCLELAEALTRHAKRILEQKTPPRSQQS